MKSVAAIKKKLEEYQNKLVLAQNAETAAAIEQKKEERKFAKRLREFADYPPVSLHRKYGRTHHYERVLMGYFLDAGIGVREIAGKFAVSPLTVWKYHRIHGKK